MIVLAAADTGSAAEPTESTGPAPGTAEPSGTADTAESAASAPAALVCLSSPARQQQVGQAAVLLGLAGSADGTRLTVDGQRTTVERWRGADPDGFHRACATVVAALQLDPGGAPSSGGGLSGLGGLLLGAVLTLTTGVLSSLFTVRMTAAASRRAEARQQATQLRDAASAYTLAVNEFLALCIDQTAPLPVGASLDEPRRRLLVQLDGLPAELGALTTAARESEVSLYATLTGSWPKAQRAADSDRVRRARAELARAQSAVEAAARGVERPRWPTASWRALARRGPEAVEP